MNIMVSTTYFSASPTDENENKWVLRDSLMSAAHEFPWEPVKL